MRCIKLSDDVKQDLITWECACSERARQLERLVSDMAWSDHARYTNMSTFDEVARVVEFCMDRGREESQFVESRREPLREETQIEEPRRDPKREMRKVNKRN